MAKYFLRTNRLILINASTTSVYRVQKLMLFLESHWVEIKKLKGGDKEVSDALSLIKTHRINNQEQEHSAISNCLNIMQTNNVKSHDMGKGFTKHTNMTQIIRN